MRWFHAAALVSSLLAIPSASGAENPCNTDRECHFWQTQGSGGTYWLVPYRPFHIVGNLYFVGSRNLGTYLITTPQGNILINPNFDANVAMIKESIERLGFKYADTKILLISHAHSDHNAGAAKVMVQTGAKYAVMEGDVATVETGGKADFQYGDKPGGLYAKAKVDRVLHDGDRIELGGTVLTAHLTPGHTPGCTTWTMTVRDRGKDHNVVIVGSPNVNPGYRLVNNKTYPGIVEDYRKTFRILKSLKADIFLGAHPDYFGMEPKLAKAKPGGTNVFLDAQGYQAYITERQVTFEKTLAEQQAAARK